MKNSLQQELKQAHQKSAKPMLWVAMISMTMMFAGLTSAYVVSRSRADWVSFILPNAFNISTTLIVLSSLTFLMAKKFIKNGNQQMTTLFLVSTLLLGLGFVYFQLDGFSQLYKEGLYFAGDQSTVKSSFVYGITVAHLAHVFAGIIVLIVVLFNHLSKKYSASNYLGLELGAIFWHFVDIVWIYLFFFFYFIR
ncbi:cytochrome c oxidase subunit 3 [Lutibacter sp.]|uniref:cytochrome c oxidase subunit 3 n=1 Tax=Lutibacter sp. TaxID=1925666 RepID=UPI0025BCE326|nr:cytochrome c oxidase subunit 3 [Lutibacter sp.]MCF6182899.1 cytochrome c oxidase subunit 3 [Lutibacter sp.]